MSKQKDGGPAFPSGAISGGNPFYGMTLRDWLAGQALQGLLSNGGYDNWDDVAQDAWNIADVMIEQREANDGETD